MIHSLYGRPEDFQPSIFGGAFIFKSAIAKKKRKIVVDLVMPYGLTQEEWTDAVVLCMASQFPLPAYSGNFASWALEVAQNPQLVDLQLPVTSPSWMEWAEALNRALANIH